MQADASAAADSSAAPDAGTASAVAPPYFGPTPYPASSPYTAANSLFASSYARAAAVELLPNNCDSQALCSAVIRCGEGDLQHTRAKISVHSCRFVVTRVNEN